MKKTLRLLIEWLLLCAITYAVPAFYFCTLDAVAWAPGARGIAGVLIAVWSGIALISRHKSVIAAAVNLGRDD